LSDKITVPASIREAGTIFLLIADFHNFFCFLLTDFLHNLVFSSVEKNGVKTGNPLPINGFSRFSLWKNLWTMWKTTLQKFGK